MSIFRPKSHLASFSWITFPNSSTFSHSRVIVFYCFNYFPANILHFPILTNQIELLSHMVCSSGSLCSSYSSSSSCSSCITCSSRSSCLCAPRFSCPHVFVGRFPCSPCLHAPCLCASIFSRYHASALARLHLYMLTRLRTFSCYIAEAMIRLFSRQ